MIAAARIITAGDGTYRPDTSGEWAAILAVHDQDGEVADLCAWFLDQPSRWWLYYGDEMPILGARALAVAAYFGDPIRLHSTPERWLLARGDGVVILRWDVDCRELFEGVSHVECDCPQLQRRFHQALRSWEPPVSIVGEARHAA